jgi:hypothetical protein
VTSRRTVKPRETGAQVRYTKYQGPTEVTPIQQIDRCFHALLAGMKGHKNIQYIETFMLCTVTDV